MEERVRGYQGPLRIAQLMPRHNRWYCIIQEKRPTSVNYGSWIACSSHCCKDTALRAAWNLCGKVYVIRSSVNHDAWELYEDGKEPPLSKTCFLLHRSEGSKPSAYERFRS